MTFWVCSDDDLCVFVGVDDETEILLFTAIAVCINFTSVDSSFNKQIV